MSKTRFQEEIEADQLDLNSDTTYDEEDSQTIQQDYSNLIPLETSEISGSKELKHNILFCYGKENPEANPKVFLKSFISTYIYWVVFKVEYYNFIRKFTIPFLILVILIVGLKVIWAVYAKRWLRNDSIGNLKKLECFGIFVNVTYIIECIVYFLTFISLLFIIAFWNENLSKKLGIGLLHALFSLLAYFLKFSYVFGQIYQCGKYSISLKKIEKSLRYKNNF